jgi:hypothetical protein
MNPSKQLAIIRLLEIYNPSIMMLEEAMMEGVKVINYFYASFLDWEFMATNALHLSFKPFILIQCTYRFYRF